MGKVSMGLSMSLDGFIAGPNDGPQQPLGEGGERLFAWYSVRHRGRVRRQASPGRTDLLRHPCGPQDWVYEGSPFMFVTDDVESAVEKAKAVAAGKDVAVGAASIAQQCMRARLLDEVHVNLVPVLLGGGVRLFEHLGNTRRTGEHEGGRGPRGDAPNVPRREVKRRTIMAEDNLNAGQQPPEPAHDLRSLGDRLVGKWEVSGDVRGTVSYEWMEGGFFLLQRVDFGQQDDGQEIKGLEVIGHERLFGEAPSEEIKSRFYSSTGDTIDYVYEMEGDTLTIWAGERDSPAYYGGTFSEDGDTLTGAWHYPGGGGYEATSTRVE